MPTVQSNYPLTPEVDELHRLRNENVRLKELLTRYGISWEEAPTTEAQSPSTEYLSTQTPRKSADKIALFRKLFRGRDDI